MYTSEYSLTTLFEQLGLSASQKHIDAFIANHMLADGTQLHEANFWSKAQADFLRESIEQDADWAEPVDELDALLRHH